MYEAPVSKILVGLADVATASTTTTEEEVAMLDAASFCVF